MTDTRGLRRQRGASAVTVAIFLFAALAALLASIDIGRLYFAQRDLQRLANLSALDGARVIGGCRGAVADPQSAASAAVASSIAANSVIGALLTSPQSTVQIGVIQTDAAGLRQFFASSADDAVAVNVTLTSPTPTRMLPLFSTGGGTMRASAAAFSAPVAAISVGTSLVNLNSSNSALLNSVLGGLLGGNVNLSVAGYKGLANAHVSLLDLVNAGVGAGTVGDFLNTPISAPALLSGIGAAVGNTDPAVAAILNQLAAIADPSRMVLPASFLPVESGLENIVGALPINTLELVQAVAQAASNGAPINLPVTVSLPGLATAAIKLKIIAPAQFARGRAGYDSAGNPRTQAHTSQGLIQVDLTLLPLSVAGLVTLNVNLHLYLTLADATARLDSLTCATSNQPFHTATVGVNTSVATLGLGQFNNLGSSNPVLVASPPLVNASVTVPLLPPIGIQVTGTAGPINVGSSVSQFWTYQGPFVPQLSQPSAANTHTFGTPLASAVDGALSTLLSTLNLQLQLTIPAVGPLLQGLLNSVVGTLTSGVVPAIASALTPILNGLDTALLNPLLDLLGLSVGSADVTVEAVQVSLPDPFGSGNRPYVELVTH